MNVPAFDATRFVRSALRSIVFYLSIIMISAMTMIKPAHASGTVTSTSTHVGICATNQGTLSIANLDIGECVTFVDTHNNVVGQTNTCYDSGPADSNNEKIACTYKGTINDQTGLLTWSGYRCPSNSTLSGGTCTCNTGYNPDPTGTSCVPAATCPVKAMTELPADDACAKVLENIHSTQAQKDAACGALTDKLKTGMACFSDKLSRTNDLVTGTPIPLKITSDIRDVAYQAHLRDIWDRMETLVRLMKNDPAMQTACATRRAEVAAEKGCDNAGRCKSCYAESATQRSHCLKGRPANSNPNDAQHTQGNAFDVSEASTITPLQEVLDARNPPQDIQQYLDAPTDCKLNWGGMFTDNYDPIHFYAR